MDKKKSSEESRRLSQVARQFSDNFLSKISFLVILETGKVASDVVQTFKASYRIHF